LHWRAELHWNRPRAVHLLQIGSKGVQPEMQRDWPGNRQRHEVDA